MYYGADVCKRAHDIVIISARIPYVACLPLTTKLNSSDNVRYFDYLTLSRPGEHFLDERSSFETTKSAPDSVSLLK